MNTKNLILTPVGNMPRAEWLAFRQPKTHIAKFLDETIGDGKINYESVTEFFKSEEWKNFIFPCVGGSEIATVVGFNPYKSVIELFYEKCGVKPVLDFDNVAMFWGRELEEQIADKWQYWDGEGETMIENYKAGKIIRKCRRSNNYIQNKNFPWIFVSLDRLINKDKKQGAKDYDEAKEGCLECKTISGYSADQWENGLPPMYVVQVQTQLGVTELPFGEIAILKDGRYMDVLPFDLNENIVSGVIEKSKIFFENVKLAAAEYILSLYAGNEALKKQHLANIDLYAPSPDGSVAYENYLKGNLTDRGGETIGTDEQLTTAREFLVMKEVCKNNEDKLRLQSNLLKSYIGTTSKLDFGGKGFVSWKADANGTRRLLVKVKIAD